MPPIFMLCFPPGDELAATLQRQLAAAQEEVLAKERELQDSKALVEEVGLLVL